MTIPAIATAAVLSGAALHAAWNVGIRSGVDRRASTAALVLGAALISLIALPFLPAPAAAAWPHLVISATLHILYFNLVAETYTLGAVSLTYPVMRGAAPALTAIIAALGFGEHLGSGGWFGLLLISSGVFLLARRQGKPGEGRALIFALGNAIVIALYTVNDGFGARISHSPIAYALWTFLLPAPPAALILLRGRLGQLFAAGGVLALFRRGLGGGFCSVASYTLALWAMTLAPIGGVAALRETAMLFGVLFAWWFLSERPGKRGIIAITIIGAGAAILDLG
jgi:drug/metabolite transporter (DMT)-like permease